MEHRGSDVGTRLVAALGLATPRALGLVLAACLVLGAAGTARAQEPPAADWERTDLGAPVRQLYTPASGAFFARTEDRLLRSDDAGATWRPVTLPPGAGSLIAVDPAIHMLIFAAGEGGLYWSGDDAATWNLVLPTPEPIQKVVVSPADNRFVLALVGRGPYTVYRSRDGGGTWERREPSPSLGSPCLWQIWLHQAHPTDPNRLFSTMGCFAGRNRSATLSHSTDLGATWSALFQPSASFPSQLVGGGGLMPGRFYLATGQNNPPGHAWLYRSDDDGATWSEALALEGTATWDGAGAVSIQGLDYDPSAPDTVYVGLAGRETGVRVSRDGGASWTNLGQGPLGSVFDLALGIDGRNLYAATDTGVWRLRLGDPATPTGPPAAAEAPQDLDVE